MRPLQPISSSNPFPTRNETMKYSGIERDEETSGAYAKQSSALPCDETWYAH